MAHRCLVVIVKDTTEEYPNRRDPQGKVWGELP
jgi:hypothetical protein